jgi:hypothetical protein
LSRVLSPTATGATVDMFTVDAPAVAAKAWSSCASNAPNRTKWFRLIAVTSGGTMLNSAPNTDMGIQALGTVTVPPSVSATWSRNTNCWVPLLLIPWANSGKGLRWHVGRKTRVADDIVPSWSFPHGVATAWPVPDGSGVMVAVIAAEVAASTAGDRGRPNVRLAPGMTCMTVCSRASLPTSRITVTAPPITISELTNPCASTPRSANPPPVSSNTTRALVSGRPSPVMVRTWTETEVGVASTRASLTGPSPVPSHAASSAPHRPRGVQTRLPGQSTDVAQATVQLPTSTLKQPAPSSGSASNVTHNTREHTSIPAMAHATAQHSIDGRPRATAYGVGRRHSGQQRRRSGVSTGPVPVSSRRRGRRPGPPGAG